MEEEVTCPFCGNPENCAPIGDGPEDFEDGEQIWYCTDCDEEFRESEGTNEAVV